MKVTVCFGSVRVVVPCGDGDILVKDLIRESTLRYKKATGKGTESWVAVHNLQSQGGGILDPDDRLSDVADDREQILASFEDGDGAHHHGGGDGASGSSVGTGSPDIFNDGEHKYGPGYNPPAPHHQPTPPLPSSSITDIEVTGEHLANGLTVNGGISTLLQVRRGSEPSLNQLAPPAVILPPVDGGRVDHTKRWSAAPLMVDPPSGGGGGGHNGMMDGWMEATYGESRREEEDDERLGGGGFMRVPRDGSNRLSMQFLGADGGGYRWAEAAERASNSRNHHISTSLPRDQKRKEPLGQANSTSPISSLEFDKGELIVIRNEPGPLGIHVVPDYDRLGKDKGLLVQGIEPGGRIDRDGRLAIFDRIIEINGQNLLNMPFQRVQEMFKLSLTSPELRLRIIKTAGLKSLRKPPPPIYPRYPDDKENLEKMVEGEPKQLSTNAKVATVSPTKKMPAVSRNLKSLLIANTRKIGRKIELELVKAPPPHGLGFSITTRDNPAGGNCPIYIKNIIPKGAAVEDGRLKIGDRLLEVNGIEMTGKSQSEAVSVLRAAPAGSKVRIVVSRQEEVPDHNLPRVIGVDPSVDPLTEEDETQPPQHSHIINGTPPSTTSDVHIVAVAPKQQPPQLLLAPNTVATLQSRDDVTPPPPTIPPLPQSHLHRNGGDHKQSPLTGNTGNSVSKIISQFQDNMNVSSPSSAAASQSQPLEKHDDITPFPWKHKQILTLDIPVHDSEKAGLGISVKGKTSGAQDLGIFIKSVIHGGAASRDRRLRTNDQLLNVNNISLLHQSNSDAMETLRKAMLHTEGPVPGSITLSIARKAASPAPQRHLYPNSVNNRSFDENSSKAVVSKVKELNRSLDGGNNNSGKFNGLSRNNSSDMIEGLYSSVNGGVSSSGDTTGDNSGGSTNTVIFNPKLAGGDSPMNTWNPVLDRLMTQTNKQLRNESYYKATNDTWNSSMYGAANLSNGSVGSTVVNMASGETILIEDEYGSRILPSQISRTNLQQQPPQLHPMLNKQQSHSHLPPITDPNPLTHPSHQLTHSHSATTVSSQSNGSITNPNNPININNTTNNINNPNSNIININSINNNTTVATNNNSTASATNNSNVTGVVTDVTYASQLSLENPAGFSRDAFGRQSMSEKRHATLDAKSTDTYQRSKKMREARDKNRGTDANLVRAGSVESVISVNRSAEHPEYADKLGQLGPSLGMKKSSSLESLQTMVQEIQMQEEGDPAYSYRGAAGALKVIRGKGCEESFRAAVDKDYNKHIVDPNHRTEISAKKHWLLDPPVDYDKDPEGFTNVRGAPRQSSLNAAIDGKNKHAKKKPGLLKGIGSMFRFGKHRKLDIQMEAQYYQQCNEFDEDNMQNTSNTTDSNPSSTETLKAPSADNQNNHITDVSREPIYQRHGFVHHHAEQVQVIPEKVNIMPPAVRYRENSNHHRQQVHPMQQHASHNQRMLQRHSYYPSGDERENIYDTRQRVEQNGVYSEYGRPGSRSGITDTAVPFTHYVNYNELQTHLSRTDQLSDTQIVQMRLQVQQQRLKVEEESRKQHQYHSQRQPRHDTQLRPVSNFYEYETVQSVLNARGVNRPPPPVNPPSSTNLNNNSPNQPPSAIYPQSHQPPPQHMQPPLHSSNSDSSGSTSSSRNNHHQHHNHEQHLSRQPLPHHVHMNGGGRQMTNAAHRTQQQQQHGQMTSRGPFVTQVTIGQQQQQQQQAATQKNGTKV